MHIIRLDNIQRVNPFQEREVKLATKIKSKFSTTEALPIANSSFSKSSESKSNQDSFRVTKIYKQSDVSLSFYLKL